MGEVYLARDPVCGRELAVKRIRPDLAKNPTVLNRFLREARVASQLCHPSIIPILNIESSPPEVYYTMPYVQGDTLRQLLRLAQESHANGQIGHLPGFRSLLWLGFFFRYAKRSPIHIRKGFSTAISSRKTSSSDVTAK